MKTTYQRIFATATAAAALLVLLFVATGHTPSWPGSSESGVTSGCKTEFFATADRYATSTETSAVWVSTVATPSLVANASYHRNTPNGIQGWPVGSPGRFTILPYFQTAGVHKTNSTPDVRFTTTTNTTKMGRRNRRNRKTTTAGINAGSRDPPAATTPRTMTFHESFNGGPHEDTSNESRWRRFRHEPLRLPDEFMARFLNTLMYLAEVITADVISGFLFGRWRPRYYQRAKKNRLHRTKRRRYRRFMMNAADVGNMIWVVCVRLRDTLYPTQDYGSRTAYQMVSNVQLTEYPTTLSTFADVPTSEIVAIVASARSSALVSIASLSAPTSAFRGLPISAFNWARVEAITTELRPAVSTYVPRLLGAPELSESASCHLRASLPGIELDTALRSADIQRSPLLLEAVPPTTRPSLFLTAARNECVATNPITPILKDFDTEREWLAVLGVNLLLKDLASASSPTSPSTRKHRPTTVASEADSGNAEVSAGHGKLPGEITNAEQGVNTPLEEFGGPADDADDTPPAPFFVSERYTPESTCYVSAHGVAYTIITMSYVHRANLPAGQRAPDDTPTTTQTGDVSDIVFTSVDANMRCKWSRECIQTVSSEYYCSSVEAVFVARFIPDETDMVVLSDLVSRHL